MLRLAEKSEIEALTEMSKNAFLSDIEFGSNGGGPTGYDNYHWHYSHFEAGDLYSFFQNEDLCGGAVVEVKGKDVFIHRIFVDCNQYRKGLGTLLMKEIEFLFDKGTVFHLDTPCFNARTNAFYQKCGYIKVGFFNNGTLDLNLYEKKN